MKMIVLIIITAFVLSGCASIEGTRNKSYTYKNKGDHGNVDSLAILPIEETSKFPMLPDMLEQKISDNLRLKYPRIKITGSSKLTNELHKSNKLEMFSSWYTGYKATKFIDFEKLNIVTENIPVDYLVSIRSVDVDREKIRGSDTGYAGMVSDTYNVYRTNLKFIGELIDLRQKKIVWQGIGYAENINSPSRDLDLFLVIYNSRNPEIEEFLGELVAVAAQGFVNEMTRSSVVTNHEFPDRVRCEVSRGL
ncbi:MAG: hypothetical protein A2101_02455 [Spirochaetes bacterium GWF2_52_7]|nr:MAG: hypothetical protein A2101_02455 [Spirochaetes bacterium GWF2_52_7]